MAKSIEERARNFKLVGSNLVFGVTLLVMLTIGTVFIYFGKDYLVDTGRVLFTVLMIGFLSVTALLFLRLQNKFAETAVELRRTIEEEEFERTRVLTLINSIKDAVVLVDENFYVRLYNAATLDLFNTNINISGKPAKDLFNSEGFDLEGVLTDLNGVKELPFSVGSQGGQGAALTLVVSRVKSGFGKVGMRGYVILAKKSSETSDLNDERATIARHDKKNSLAVISGSLENLVTMLERDGVELSEPVSKTIEVAQNEIVELRKKLDI